MPTKRKKPTVFYGTKSSNAIKSAPRRLELFVFNVDASIDDEHLREFIASEHVDVLELERMSKEEAWTQSFRVLVTAPNPRCTLDSDFWPHGIGMCVFTGGSMSSEHRELRVTVLQENTEHTEYARRYQHVMSVINADSLAVASYNCDGVTSSTGFINNLLSDTKIDILCLQETWLLDRDIAKLSNIHADYQFNGKSGVDATERILPGRPQGGVAIAWHKGLSHHVKPVHISNKRMCAVRTQLNVHKYILIVCIYMPCDTYSNTNGSIEYDNCINCLEELLSQYEQDDIIMCGEPANTSFKRDTCQTRFMTAFMERNDLRLSWHHPMANKSNTYVNHNLHHESCIDHFVVSSNVYGNIRQHDVNDTPLNPATHCPVILVFDTSYRYTYEEPEHVAGELPVKVAWHKVNDETIDRYKRRID